MPLVDQIAGKAMAQIVNAHVLQPRLLPGRVPAMKNAHERLAGLGIGKQVLITRQTRQLRQQRQQPLRHGRMARLSGLIELNAPQALVQIDILPFGIQYLALKMA